MLLFRMELVLGMLGLTIASTARAILIFITGLTQTASNARGCCRNLKGV
jgi:hypothetical protein